MSESAQSAYTENAKPAVSQIQPDDRNDPPNLVEAIKSERTVEEPIKKDIGDTVVITAGRDYDSPKVRVVPNTYHNAEDHEKALHISQGKGVGISISLNTLKQIIAWAEKEDIANG